MTVKFIIVLFTNIQNSGFKSHSMKFTIVIFFDFSTCVVIPQRTLLVIRYVMMMIASNCLVRQKEGAEGDEEEEAGDRRKGGQTETLTPGADSHRFNTVRGVGWEEQEKT